MFRIEFHIFIFAVEGRCEQLRAELEQVDADLATGAGEGVEGVEVDVGSYGGDDTKYSSRLDYPLDARHLAATNQ